MNVRYACSGSNEITTSEQGGQLESAIESLYFREQETEDETNLVVLKNTF